MVFNETGGSTNHFRKPSNERSVPTLPFSESFSRKFNTNSASNIPLQYRTNQETSTARPLANLATTCNSIQQEILRKKKRRQKVKDYIPPQPIYDKECLKDFRAYMQRKQHKAEIPNRGTIDIYLSPTMSPLQIQKKAIPEVSLLEPHLESKPSEGLASTSRVFASNRSFKLNNSSLMFNQPSFKATCLSTLRGHKSSSSLFMQPSKNNFCSSHEDHILKRWHEIDNELSPKTRPKERFHNSNSLHIPINAVERTSVRSIARESALGQSHPHIRMPDKLEKLLDYQKVFAQFSERVLHEKITLDNKVINSHLFKFLRSAILNFYDGLVQLEHFEIEPNFTESVFKSYYGLNCQKVFLRVMLNALAPQANIHKPSEHKISERVQSIIDYLKDVTDTQNIFALLQLFTKTEGLGENLFLELRMRQLERLKDKVCVQIVRHQEKYRNYEETEEQYGAWVPLIHNTYNEVEDCRKQKDRKQPPELIELTENLLGNHICEFSPKFNRNILISKQLSSVVDTLKD